MLFSMVLGSLWCFCLMKMSTFAGTISREDWLLLARPTSAWISLPSDLFLNSSFVLFLHLGAFSFVLPRLIFYLCCTCKPKLLWLSSEDSQLCSLRKANGTSPSVFTASGDERLWNSERLRLESSWREATFCCSVEERSSFSFSCGHAAGPFSRLTTSCSLATDLDLEEGLGARAGLEREQRVSCELLGLRCPRKACSTFRLISSHDCPSYPSSSGSAEKRTKSCWSKSSSIIMRRDNRKAASRCRWIYKRSSAGRFDEELDAGLALVPADLRERGDLLAGVLVDELEAVGVEVDLEELLVELDEVEQPRVEAHVDGLPHLLAPQVGHHAETDLLPLVPLAPLGHNIY